MRPLCLLTLPAEIRAKIIRKLMKSSQIIRPLQGYSGPAHVTDSAEHRQNVNLSSRILRCRQLLYRKGVQIIYNENMLRLSFDLWYPGNASWTCKTLDGAIQIACFVDDDP